MNPPTTQPIGKLNPGLNGRSCSVDIRIFRTFRIFMSNSVLKSSCQPLDVVPENSASLIPACLPSCNLDFFTCTNNAVWREQTQFKCPWRSSWETAEQRKLTDWTFSQWLNFVLHYPFFTHPTIYSFLIFTLLFLSFWSHFPSVLQSLS